MSKIAKKKRSKYLNINAVTVKKNIKNTTSGHFVFQIIRILKLYLITFQQLLLEV